MKIIKFLLLEISIVIFAIIISLIIVNYNAIFLIQAECYIKKEISQNQLINISNSSFIPFLLKYKINNNQRTDIISINDKNLINYHCSKNKDNIIIINNIHFSTIINFKENEINQINKEDFNAKN